MSAVLLTLGVDVLMTGLTEETNYGPFDSVADAARFAQSEPLDPDYAVITDKASGATLCEGYREMLPVGHVSLVWVFA